MASITQLCEGTWLHDLTKDENIEEYLKLVGISKPIRMVAKKMKTNIKIHVDENNQNKFTFTRMSTLENKETVFVLGETFTDKAYGGKMTTNLWKIDGHNKMVGVSNGFCKHEIHITLEFFDDATMIQTYTVNGVVARNHFNKEKK